MAEQSGFFDAHLVNGVYDRTYLADNFAKYFASFIGNGVFGGKSNELMVQQKETADMSVRVLSGQGWINGYWYENSNEVSLAIDVADGVLNRIDLVVLRWDNTQRVIRVAVKKGVPASVPSIPTLQRSADYYELKLAQININAGLTKITQANITDTRLNTEECGLVHAVVDQLDSAELGIQLDAYISEFIAKHDTWSTQFQSNSNSSVNTLLSNSQTKVDKLINDKTAEINGLINEFEQVLSNNDAVAINARIDGINDKIGTFASKSTRVDRTITVADWAAGSFYLSSSAITANSVVELIPGQNVTLAQLEALQAAQIVGGTQEAGKILIKCLGTKPTVAIPVTFIIRGDL